jgi:hypothetical protein
MNAMSDQKWDLFISHALEDKRAFVAPLVGASRVSAVADFRADTAGTDFAAFSAKPMTSVNRV